ncbi:hypothetical protein CNMCM5623_001367 [Aspergillus felis]|uniref:Acid phosphatase n=1 Tax=Aspergillus felis TaxID=1287682 RepID=A0A8H6UMI2_9EURO|nr:hypothetical protein CNMCM5623_001367 [Aspergillus felis]KAF7180585.1 hypothetical protein CNMCM7691_009876 [Aspergillus felis]
MFATSAALVALAALASGQNALPAAQVPFIGGGVLQKNDPRLANYTFVYRPPFDPEVYGGYYHWSVNNETVAVANFTGYDAKDGYSIPDDSYTMYPFFSVGEKNPRGINQTPLFKPKEEDCDKDPKFKKILHIIFENEVFSWTMADPYWQLLARRGKLLTNSHGVTHPSLPNYAAFLAGDVFGLAKEDFYNIDATTIYDLLDVKGIDYATYVEWYSPAATKRGPLDCNNYIFNGPIDSTNPNWSSQSYRRLDVPALLFSTYTSEYERCAKIYNATERFADDVKSGKLPAYSYYVPDMLHNGHDPNSDSDYVHQTTTSGSWFNAFLDLYLPELEKQGTLVVATFDEATWQNDDDTTPNNNNQIVTLLFGAGVTPNTKDDSYITHYGVLRGAIQNFGLGSLGRNDTNATNGNLFDLVH